MESRKHVDGFRIAKNVDSMHLVQNSKYPTTVTQKLLSSRISVHFAQIKVKKTLTLIDLHLNSATRTMWRAGLLLVNTLVIDLEIL